MTAALREIIPIVIIYGLGGVWVKLLVPRGPLLLLFLSYVNVFRMRPWSRLSSQLLTIPVPQVTFHVGKSIPLVLGLLL